MNQPVYKQGPYTIWPSTTLIEARSCSDPAGSKRMIEVVVPDAFFVTGPGADVSIIFTTIELAKSNINFIQGSL